MAYSYKTYSDMKDVMKKFVNASEGSVIYSLGKTRFMTLAKEAGAGLSSKVCKFSFTGFVK